MLYPRVMLRPLPHVDGPQVGHSHETSARQATFRQLCAKRNILSAQKVDPIKNSGTQKMRSKRDLVEACSTINFLRQMRGI